MKKNKKILVFGIIAVLLVAGAIALVANSYVRMDSKPESTEITVYNSGVGLVKEQRTESLVSGINTLTYSNIASGIDASSVRLIGVTKPIKVLEQNYIYNTVSMDKLLDRFIGKNITAFLIYGSNKETVQGTLLSHSGNSIIMKMKDGSIQTLSTENVVLPSLPDGLVAKPSLEWQVNSDSSQDNKLELTYLTSGLTWDADYAAEFDGSSLSLSSMVTMTNNAGTDFDNAKLSLVAGQVNTGERFYAPNIMMKTADSIGSGSSQFAQESISDYHLYSLDRPATLKNGQQKQIGLFDASGIKVKQEYVLESSAPTYYFGQKSMQRIAIELGFTNSKSNSLGIPMPAGKVRVYKQDSTGSRQLIGEDSIGNIAEDENVSLKIGYAFDIDANKQQTSFSQLGNYNDASYSVVLRNHKDSDVTVKVVETPYGDWQLTESSLPGVKESQNRLVFEVPVKANSEATLTYTIRQIVK
jgi:hypothetical protein